MSNLEDWKGSYPVFVLELTWGGITYYLSTEPIETDSIHGKVKYIGGMVEPPLFDQQIKEGFNLDSLSVSIAAMIADVTVSSAILGGQYIEQSEAELSMLLVKNGVVLSYEKRVQLFRGYVTQPVFGHIDKPLNYIEFSIESKVFDSSVYALLTGSSARCNSEDISAIQSPITNPFAAVLNSVNRIIIYEAHKGKQIPFCFGIAGRTIDQTGTLIDFPATPAYVVAHDVGTQQIYILIASHPVKDTSIKLHDNRGNSVLITGGYGNVQQFTMRDKRVFSFIKYSLSGGFVDNIINDTSVQYWVSWREGGYISPSKEEPLEKGGDLCLWLLQQGLADIDYHSWESVRSFLNAYKFAGYIKESEETPIEFLDKNILPFLPISVINGNEGLRAVPDLLCEGIPIVADHSITANPEFLRVSPVTTLTDPNEIINNYTLEYAFDGSKSAYRSVMRLKPDQNYYTNSQFTNLYAEISKQRFGHKELIEESLYIYDDDTAALVCKDKIKNLAFPKRQVTYLSSPRYGYINIGDIIDLTDSSLGIVGKKAQVTRKVFKETNWEYTITLNDHKIQEIEQ